jgi:hypothetical protein
LASHAGTALLARVADKVGLTRALSLRLGDLKQRRSGHDLGHVVRDLAVMLADGSDRLANLDALGDQGSGWPGRLSSPLTEPCSELINFTLPACNWPTKNGLNGTCGRAADPAVANTAIRLTTSSAANSHHSRGRHLFA